MLGIAAPLAAAVVWAPDRTQGERGGSATPCASCVELLLFGAAGAGTRSGGSPLAAAVFLAAFVPERGASMLVVGPARTSPIGSSSSVGSCSLLFRRDRDPRRSSRPPPGQETACPSRSPELVMPRSLAGVRRLRRHELPSAARRWFTACRMPVGLAALFFSRLAVFGTSASRFRQLRQGPRRKSWRPVHLLGPPRPVPQLADPPQPGLRGASRGRAGGRSPSSSCPPAPFRHGAAATSRLNPNNGDLLHAALQLLFREPARARTSSAAHSSLSSDIFVAIDSRRPPRARSAPRSLDALPPGRA